MARLPSYTSSVPLDIGSDTFRASADTGSSAITEGLKSFGSGVFNAGQAMAKADKAAEAKLDAEAERNAAWSDEMELMRLKERVTNFAEEQKEKVGATGEGYAAAVEDFAQREYDTLKTSGVLSRKYPVKNDRVFEGIRIEAAQGAAKWQVGAFNKFRSDLSDSRVKDSVAVVSAKGGAGLDEALGNWQSFVERTQGLESRTGQAMLKVGRDQIERAALFAEAESAKRGGGKEFVAKLQGLFTDTPSASTGNPMVDATLKHAPAIGIDAKWMLAAGWIESNLNPNHDGPRKKAGTPRALGRKGDTHLSSAEGGWQFLDADVINAGLSLKDKFDPEKSTALMSQRYKWAKDKLDSAGVEANAGLMFASHNMGGSVWLRYIKADPSTPIEQVFRDTYPNDPKQAAQALANNPRMYKAGMTVGQVRANYDAELAKAQAEVERRFFGGDKTATAGNTEAQVRQAISEFMGRDMPNVSTRDAMEIFATVQKNVGIQTKDQADIAAGAAYFNNPRSIDPYDASQMKLANRAFDAQHGSAIVAGVGQNKPEAVKVALDATRQLGAMPEKAIHGFRAALDSGSPEIAQGALAALAELSRADEPAYRASKLEKIRDDVDTYTAYTDVLGLDAVEATKRILFDRSPEGQAAREAMKERIAKEWKGSATTPFEANEAGWKEVTAHLSKGAWFNAEAIDDRRRDAIVDSYQKGIAYHRLQGRDVQLAKAFTLQDIAKTFGRDDATGQIMMFPPKNNYPPIEGSHKWIAEQAEGKLREYLVGIGKIKSIDPVSSPEMLPSPGGGMASMAANMSAPEKTPKYMLVAAAGSGADHRAGRPISYNMFYEDETGKKQIAVGVKFTPDYHAAYGKAREKFVDDSAKREAATQAAIEQGIIPAPGSINIP